MRLSQALFGGSIEMQIESARKVFGRTAPLAALVIAVATVLHRRERKSGETRQELAKRRPATAGAEPASAADCAATPPAPSAPKARIGAVAPIPARPLGVRRSARRETPLATPADRFADQGRVDCWKRRRDPRRGSEIPSVRNSPDAY
jgi:hypothetical protein